MIAEKRAQPTGIVSLRNKGHLGAYRRDFEQDRNVYQEIDQQAIVVGGSAEEDSEERQDVECSLDAKDEVAEEGHVFSWMMVSCGSSGV